MMLSNFKCNYIILIFDFGKENPQQSQIDLPWVSLMKLLKFLFSNILKNLKSLKTLTSIKQDIKISLVAYSLLYIYSFSKNQKSFEKYDVTDDLPDVLTHFGAMRMDEEQEQNSHKFPKPQQLKSKNEKKRMQDGMALRKSEICYIGRL